MLLQNLPRRITVIKLNLFDQKQLIFFKIFLPPEAIQCYCLKEFLILQHNWRNKYTNKRKYYCTITERTVWYLCYKFRQDDWAYRLLLLLLRSSKTESSQWNQWSSPVMLLACGYLVKVSNKYCVLVDVYLVDTLSCQGFKVLSTYIPIPGSDSSLYRRYWSTEAATCPASQVTFAAYCSITTTGFRITES